MTVTAIMVVLGAILIAAGIKNVSVTAALRGDFTQAKSTGTALS